VTTKQIAEVVTRRGNGVDRRQIGGGGENRESRATVFRPGRVKGGR
jgi:hypothetical protein